MPESLNKPPGMGHSNPPERMEPDPGLRGIRYMQQAVDQTTERAKPFKLSLRDRAKLIGDEKLLDEMHDLIERDIRQPLFSAFGADTSPQNVEKAKILVRDNLLIIAGIARSFAIHHRLPKPFRVGAAILALRNEPSSDGNPWVVMFDANTKLNKDHKPTADGIKWCAEQYLMDRIADPQDLDDKEIQRVLTIAIVAEIRPDDKSGIAHKTLTPCAICRDRMVYDKKLTAGDKPIIRPNTEVYTVDAEKESNQESRDVGKLHETHGETIEVD